MAKRESAPSCAAQAVTWLPVDALRPNPRNPRKHGQEVLQLARTILRTTWGAPIVVQARSHRIIGGHGRLEAAREILAGIEVDGELRGGADHVFAADAPGPAMVPVRIVDVSDAEADAMTLADNARAIQGHDDAAMIVEMASAFERDAAIMADIGLGSAALDALIKQAGDAVLAAGEERKSDDSDDADAEATASDLDRAAELQGKWNTAQGQLWLIESASGLEHRILCGDCRNAADVARLLDGRKVDVAFTSPPYASQRKYDEESGFKPIHPDEFVEWFEPVQSNVRSALADGGSWFVNIKAHVEDGQRSLYVIDLVTAHAESWRWRFVDEFVWHKTAVPGSWPNRFRNDWEPVFHFCTSKQIKFRPQQVTHASDRAVRGGGGSPKTSGGAWGIPDEWARPDGEALPGNVVKLGTGGSESVHSAAFPVGLPEFFIKAFSDEGDLIFDPFLGSATTIVAADRNGRVGAGTELSPKYVAVCLERLSALGMKPRLA